MGSRDVGIAGYDRGTAREDSTFRRAIDRSMPGPPAWPFHRRRRSGTLSAPPNHRTMSNAKTRAVKQKHRKAQQRMKQKRQEQLANKKSTEKKK